MAGNRIKGITIEIGGDTTKLDKALSGTNKQLKDTETKLKDVERLLKLDPGNVELLDQKQRLLAQSVDATSEKLKTLKRVAEESTVSNVKYEQWSKSFAAIQGQITKTGEELAKVEKESEKLADLGFTLDSEPMVEAREKAEALREKLDDLNKKVTDTYEELGRPISIDQWDAIQRELSETETSLEQAEKSLDQFNITAGETGAAAENVVNGAAKVAEATKSISTAAGGAAGGLITMAVNAGKAADDLNTLSKQSGFSTEELQKWQYAADLVDVSVDDIVSAARNMKKNMVSESEATQQAFAQLGVSVYDNSGQIRDATGFFYQLLDNLSRVPNETERDILAMQIFGKSADDLAGIIDDGGKALRQLGEEAEAAGLILSQDALDSANKFNDGLDTLKAKATAAFMESGASLAENLLPVMEAAVEAVSSLLEWFAGLDSETLGVLLKVLLAVAAIAPVASAISATAGAVSAVSTGVGALTAALGSFNIVGTMTTLTLGKWVLIIGAVVAAVWALVEAYNALTGEKSGTIERMERTKTRPNVPSGSFSRSTSGYSLQTASAENLPHLARGTVTRPNSPFMAVVGDNPQEPEVISPLSTIRQAVMEAQAASGGRSGRISVNITFAGEMAQLARVMNPQIKVENQRLGPQLVN